MGLLLASKAKTASIHDIPDAVKPFAKGETASLLASGAKLRNYSFDIYKSKKKDAPTLTSLEVQSPLGRVLSASITCNCR